MNSYNPAHNSAAASANWRHPLIGSIAWVVVLLSTALPLAAQEDQAPPDSAEKGWFHNFIYGRKYVDEEKGVIVPEEDTTFTRTVEGRIKTLDQAYQMEPQKGLIPIGGNRQRKTDTAQLSKEAKAVDPLDQDTTALEPDTTGLFYVYVYAKRKVGDYFSKEPVGEIVVSDGYGDFSLNIRPSDSVLMFRYNNYWIKEVRLPDTDEENTVLEEIVLPLHGNEIHYGAFQEDRRHNTSAVSTAKERHFANAQSVSFDAQMQGRIAGLQILQTTGMPGSDVMMRLRGPSSYLADSKPLIIVDGVQVTSGTNGDGGGGIGEHYGAQTNPLAHINPSDIEKVEVLKDADALAMYGARGGNGVINVRTKRGDFGRTKFDVSYMTGPTFPTNEIDVLDAQQYRSTLDQAFRNTHDSAQGFDRSFYIIPDTIRGMNFDSTGNARIRDFLANSGSAENPLEDAMQSGYVHDIGLSASGGNERVNFHLGANYRDEKGTLKGQDFQRLTTRFNADNVAIPGKLKLGVSLGMTFSTENYSHTGLDTLGGFGSAQSTALPIFPYQYPSQLGNVIGDSTRNDLRFFPDNPYFDPFSGDNIGLTMDKAHVDNERQVFRNMANLYGEYNILPNLQFRADLGSDYLTTTDRTFNSRFARLNKVEARQTENTDSVFVPQAFAMDARQVFFSLNYRAQLEYSARLGKDHFLSAIVGGDGIQSIHSLNASSSEDFPSDETRLVSSGSIESDVARGRETGFAYAGGFARLSYKLKKRYMLNLTGRMDGSSRFGEDVTAGFFPAVGLGWLVSEESFLENSTTVDFLKLRASAGSSGNSAFGNQQKEGIWNGGQNFMISSLLGRFPRRFPNNDMTWERVNQANIGADFSLLGHRISGSVETYLRRTNDMLLDFPMTPSLGMADTAFIENRGTMRNAGLELTLRTANIVGKFSWHTFATLARNWNQVTDLGGFESRNFGGFRDLRIAEGETLGAFFLPKHAGVAQQDDPNGNYVKGDELVYDQNGNKFRPQTVGALDSARQLIADKSPFPKIFGGFGNRFTYGNFDLTIYLTYSFGRYLLDDGERRQSYVTGNNNLRVEEDRSGDNPNLYYSGAPGTDFVDPFSQINTTRFLHKADYIRFRDITIGYNLPKSLLNKTLIPGKDNPIVADARVFFSARNVLTLTSFNGWDPESATSASSNRGRNLGMGITAFDQPQVQSYMVGFNLTF